MTAPLIDHLWQSTIVALAAWALAAALRQREARVRYWVWLAASLKFLVPFAALVALGHQLEWPAATAPPAPSVERAIVVAERVVQPMAALAPAPAEPETVVPAASGNTIGAAPVLAAVWLFGFALVLGRWLERWLRLRRVVRAATPVVLEQLAGRGIEARVSASKIEPGIVGIVRAVLILPEGILERLAPKQLDAVIAHELCHVRRRDNLTAAIHMAVAAVFWFHPLVWLIGARLIAERERACDEAVVAAGADPATYAQSLIEVCRLYVESPLPCAAGIGGGATLQARVRSIAELRTVRRLTRAWRAALAAAASLALGAPLALGVLTAPSVAAQSQADRAAAITEATIEAGEADRGYRLGMSNGGVLTTLNQPLRALIAFAYDLQQYEVVGPDELDTRRYSIHTRAPHAAPTTDDYRLLLRDLLEQRFGLHAHTETRSLPVVVLGRATDELGPGLTRVAASPAGGGAYARRESHSWVVTNQPLRSLTSWLSNVLRKPVLDETGLRESYSFELRWESAAPAGVFVDPTQDALERAIEPQLGLTLTEEQRSVEVLVVDRVAEPSGLRENRTVITLSPEVLDGYSGYYGILATDSIMTVRRNGDHLVGEPLGEAQIALYPFERTRFFAPTGDADVTFVAGASPRLLLRRPSSEMSLPRLDPATAEARLAELRGRIERQEAQPGGEAVVRRIARELASERPVRSVRDHALMLRDALRSEAPTAFANRGALRAVTFKGVAPTARDVYEVAFENWTFEVLLGLDADGGVSSLSHRSPAGGL